MLQIRFSNRFERLEDALVDALAEPPASPFAAEELIVPSAAIRRRVELVAADRFGICSNMRFSFLAQWLWRQIGQVVPVAEVSPFTAPVLTWRVLDAFDDAAFVAAHPRLDGYLRQADEVMRYDLAARSAVLLEQYLAYRADWLAAWLEGKPAGIAGLDAAHRQDERWQAALWRRIAQALGTDRRHPSVVFFDAMARMGPDAPRRAGLPERAHVFCLPTMPPLYLDILHRLAQWIDLRLYVLNPCREYWLEAVDPRRLAYLAVRDRAVHHEVGNRLLAAWGKQAQAHIDLLFAHDTGAQVDDADFEPADGPSLLARVQNAILDMTDLERGSIAPAPDDRSIEVHVCHSMTRELEVLHDQLLALFAGPDAPRPADILVVMPDLESAAPLIDAVFGNAPRGCEIAYTITGRPASVLNPCAHALLAVLAVATSRFPASAVFELLQQPVIARRFGLDGAALEAIHEWMRAAAIRWGLDGEHRAEFRLPTLGQHSFADGLDRLFLGYALPAGSTTPVNERLGAGDPEGAAALALGGFRAFVHALERLHRAVRSPRTPGEWRDVLLDALDRFVAPAADEIDERFDTAAVIGQLHADATRGGMTAPVPVEVIRVALQAALDDPTRGGTPGGAVTFAAMPSLRSLPYRIVCVLGLNDGAFPASERPPEFDLMAQAPRRGDRQRRTDDRNLFLDLVLAARARLYLSYTGRSVRDNAPLPPSVLVAALLDYCVAAIQTAPFTPETLRAARARLVVEHPLQPFSLDYFVPDADPRRRSFRSEYCEALRAQLAARAALRHAPLATGPAIVRVTAVPTGAAGDDGDADEHDAPSPQDAFFPTALASAGAEFRTLTLAQLARFVRNPCRYLLDARLGIVLPVGGEALQDDEPLVPDFHGRRGFAERILPVLLAGGSARELRDFARAGLEYPAGPLGGRALENELERLQRFARMLVPLLAPPPLEAIAATLEFDLDGETWQLDGGFGDLRAGGLIRYRYDDARAVDYLNGWVEHLFLNAIAPHAVERRTVWYSRDGHYLLRPVTDARAHLATLVRLYRDGLQRPVHFFPKSAWAYITANADLAKARSAWQNTSLHRSGEENDPAYRLALRGVDNLLDNEFEGCATAVFAPLLAAIEDERLRAHS